MSLGPGGSRGGAVGATVAVRAAGADADFAMGGTASCAGATVESNTRLEKATSSAVRIGMSLVVATGAGGEDTRVDAGPQRLISIRDSSASRLVAGANERALLLYGLEQRLHLRGRSVAIKHESFTCSVSLGARG